MYMIFVFPIMNPMSMMANGTDIWVVIKNGRIDTMKSQAIH